MIDDSILDWFRGRSVLVTGGTGMVGRQIVDLLCDAGACVRTASLDQLHVDPRAEHMLGDLTDIAFCHEATRDMEIVFHVAGIKGSVEVTTRQPASFFVPLLLMNTNVLEAARVSGVKRLVYTSSIGAYPSRDVFREVDAWDGAPMDLFPGWAKRMGELQLQAYQREFGIDTFSVVRLANVYGPGDNFDPVERDGDPGADEPRATRRGPAGGLGRRQRGARLRLQPRRRRGHHPRAVPRHRRRGGEPRQRRRRVDRGAGRGAQRGDAVPLRVRPEQAGRLPDARHGRRPRPHARSATAPAPACRTACATPGSGTSPTSASSAARRTTSPRRVREHALSA